MGEEYWNKYLKWKRKTKVLRSQGKQTRKVKGVENYSNIFEDFQRKLIRETKCIECNKYGHCALECVIHAEEQVTNKRIVIRIIHVRNVTGRDIQKGFVEIENLKERKSKMTTKSKRKGGS